MNRSGFRGFGLAFSDSIKGLLVSVLDAGSWLSWGLHASGSIKPKPEFPNQVRHLQQSQRRQVKHQSKLRSEFVSDSLHNTNPDPDLPLSKPPAIGINAQMKPPLPSSPPESYLGPAQAEETASTPKFKPSSWGSAVWGGGGVFARRMCAKAFVWKY